MITNQRVAQTCSAVANRHSGRYRGEGVCLGPPEVEAIDLENDSLTRVCAVDSLEQFSFTSSRAAVALTETGSGNSFCCRLYACTSRNQVDGSCIHDLVDCVPDPQEVRRSI